ncbi:phage repressor protein CI [Enterobacter hormaechei subsp. xiangfangensis]|nr:phage repressor protein CI [Enterobacter hormaechei]MDR9905460.1 phage repressor protein CI [Enterobacter hormaechei subsp. xiangfangensis]
MDFNSGGKKVIERLVEAYGFNTRQALCDHLGVSKSTMATRYMRDIFPADWVLQCTLETGVSIEWLAFGRGHKIANDKNKTIALIKQTLIEGKLIDSGSSIFDINFLPPNLVKPLHISEKKSDFICDMDFETVRDGVWVINIDGDILIRTITRLPGNRIHIDGGSSAFECALQEIKVIAKVVVCCLKKD